MSSRRRRLQKQRRGSKRIILRVVGITAAALFLVIALSTVVAAASVDAWLSDLPDYNDPKVFQVAQATRVYSADGELLAKLYLENRTVIPLRRMSGHLVNAVVAVEDERFFEHSGVDPQGIVRAFFATVGGTREGASTITQQFVRNTALLDERTDITAARKIREAYLAMQLEKRHTKNEILEMYLNTIYLGEGAYGAEAAARTYFSKPAADLKISEAAMLAGLAQAPSRLDPFENPQGAKARRNQVLARMLANGYISRDQYKRASESRLNLKRGTIPEQGIYDAPYFVSHVRRWLLNKYPQSVVFKGGLKVYTTLDTKMQRKAEAAVNAELGPGDPEAALVCIDPRTGHIRAMVGGRSYSKSKFNLATQGKRQSGSSFKTFALVAAMQEGVPPYQDIDSSSPAVIPTKPKPWVVSNSEGAGRGMMSLESATHSSVNAVFARLTWEIGADKVAATAKRMGITTPLPNYPSISLGTRNVNALEMASAYGTLATGGVHYVPMSVTKIIDDKGEVMYRRKPTAERAIPPSVAKAATDVLRGVIEGGTGTRAYIGRPAAGKTGTSQNYRDAWFVGYTPQLVTAVWVGYTTEKPMYSVNGDRGFGGTLAAPIWARFMRAALEGRERMAFKDAPEPDWNPDKFDFPVSRQARRYDENRRREQQTDQNGQDPPATSGTPSDGTPTKRKRGTTKPPPPPPPPSEPGTGNAR